jgi:hypothetical protein
LYKELIMLKKLTLVTVAAVFTMTMGIANAAPAQTSPVELTSAEMDTVNAGGWNRNRNRRHHYNRDRVRGNSASARADAVALGNNTRATTRTDTFSGPGVSDSSSRSNSSSNRGRTVRHYNPSCGCKRW